MRKRRRYWDDAENALLEEAIEKYGIQGDVPFIWFHLLSSWCSFRSSHGLLLLLLVMV